MSRCCPHCHGTGLIGDDGDGERIPVEAMLATCRDNGWYVSPDGKVRRDVAARLIDRTEKTLANWEAGAAPIPSIKRNGGRYYSLQDLSDFTASV